MYVFIRCNYDLFLLLPFSYIFFLNIIFKENDNEKLCGNKFNINHQIIRIYESCTKTREKQLISRTEC